MKEFILMATDNAFFLCIIVIPMFAIFDCRTAALFNTTNNTFRYMLFPYLLVNS